MSSVPEVEDVIAQISTALGIARDAVQADNSKQYSSAMLLYGHAVTLMEETAPMIPEALRDQLLDQATKYRARVDQLAVVTTFDVVKPRREGGKLLLRSAGGVTLSHAAFHEVDIRETPEVSSPPRSMLRRCFWKMRLLKQSVEKGGHITPFLYIPSEVWSQEWKRFPGLGTKMSAFGQLVEMLDRLRPVPLPTSSSERDAASAALMEFVAGLSALQCSLSRPFPFIPNVDDEKSTNAGTGKLGAFASSIGSFSRSVGKRAAGVYERVQTAIPTRIMEGDMIQYTRFVAILFEKCQFLDAWMVAIEEDNPVAVTGPNNRTSLRPRTSLAFSSRSSFLKGPNFINMAKQIAKFMNVVVLELTVRDLEVLVDRYMRSMRKSFGRFYWDNVTVPASTGTDEMLMEHS